MNQEIRPINGYEGLYSVSADGCVFSNISGKMLKPKIESNGYVRVHLSKHGVAKSILLHRIVASAFIPNPNNFKTVNHIDENKANNAVSNLEWCDMSYQNRYGVGAKKRNEFKEKPISQWTLSGEFVRNWRSIKQAATELGLNSSSIICVCDGKRRYKSTGGFVFKREGEIA